MFSPSEKNSLILQNAVTERIGRPIIIGYNRRENSQNRLGALVIIPEREFGGGGGMSDMGMGGMGGMDFGGGIGGANQQDAGAFNSMFEQSAK